MTCRATLLAALVVLLTVSTAFAQQQTGEIFGRVVDNSGAVLPGVTVSVSGPALIQPRIVTMLVRTPGITRPNWRSAPRP